MIFIDSNIPFLDDVLSEIDEIKIFSGSNLSSIDLIISKAKYLFTRSTIRINEELLKGTEVEFVATATSGTDHVDLEYLQDHQIFFASALGSNANSVAEYVIWNILRWSIDHKIDIMKKTIGIVGFGNVGKLVAKYSNLLGLKVLLNDPPLLDLNYNFDYEHLQLDKLIRQSDILTIHVPLTFEGKHPTYHLFDKETIRILKKNTLFIHTSRGGVVKEIDLIDRLHRKNIYCVVDVWKNEPDFNSELFKLCCFASPHIAGHAFDSKLNGSKMMLDAFSEFKNIDINSNIIHKELSYKQNISISEFSNYDSLFQKISNSRQLIDDFHKMNEMNNLPSNLKKSEFSKFRSEYPIRREIL